MINIRADVRYTREAVLNELAVIAQSDERITQDEIARRLEMCRKTVYNHLRALVASGHIEIINTKPMTYKINEARCG